MWEPRPLGLLMKCSLHLSWRRGPAVGARSPARNNNAGEVKPTGGARPAVGDVSIQRSLRAGPGGRGTAGAPRARRGRAGRGRAEAVQLIT